MRTNRSDVEVLRLYLQNHDSTVMMFRNDLHFELISIYGNFNFQRQDIRLLNLLNVIIVVNSVQLQFFVQAIYGTYYNDINYKCHHFHITLVELYALKKFLNYE